ncbi:MAG TPA: lysophospholipid acyltransferase family protein [bacterium]|nr:lysophospholipid acyltransferase family protein [bacterium]HPQ18249.1 lysophospholipid acyltransferase family protein [bacterium]
MQKKFKHYVEFIIVKILFFIISKISLNSLYSFSHLFGKIFYKYFFIKKKVLFNNLRIVFKNKSSKFYNELALKVCINFAKTFFEFFKLNFFNKNNIDKYAKFYNLDILENILKKGKGVILVSAHIDNWEFLGCALTLKGFPIVAMAKRQNNRLVDELIIKQRTGCGMQIIYKGISVKDIFKALKRNKIIGIIGDVRGDENKINSFLFGLPASTHEGLAVFAYRTNTDIVPVFSYRDINNIHHIIFEEPINVNKENEDTYIKDVINEYNKRLENFIRLHPDQWFYFHRRWGKISDHYYLKEFN